MNMRQKIQALPIPPGDYRREDFNQIARKLNQLIDNVFNPGDLVATRVILINPPESGYGQPIGTLYVDAPSGDIKIVQENVAYAPSFLVRTKLRNVAT